MFGHFMIFNSDIPESTCSFPCGSGRKYNIWTEQELFLTSFCCCNFVRHALKAKVIIDCNLDKFDLQLGLEGKAFCARL